MSPASAENKRHSYSPDSPSVPSPGNSNSNDSAIESLGGSPPPENHLSSRKRKPVDKESDQYKARRERNNEAVRKSRAKSKLKRQQTDSQLRQLQNDKRNLELQVEMLNKELYLIRSWVKQPKAEPPEMDGQGMPQPLDFFAGSNDPK